jgi:hypothetical protein
MQSISLIANAPTKTRLCTISGQIASSAEPRRNVIAEQKTNYEKNQSP